jgi:hypothetical protein
MHHGGTVAFSKVEQQEDESGSYSHCLDLYVKEYMWCTVLGDTRTFDRSLVMVIAFSSKTSYPVDC